MKDQALKFKRPKEISPLVIALIGVGGFGFRHRVALEQKQQEGLVHLKAIADPTITKYPQLHRDLIRQGVTVYLDHNEMLRSEPTLDAVTIVAPIPYHEEIAKACLARGLKIYLEKPPVPLIQQLDNLIALDSRNSVHVGFQMIGSSWATTIKNWITEGKLGLIKGIRAGACWPRTNTYYHRAAWAGKMIHAGRPTFDGPATNALSHLIHCIMYIGEHSADGFTEPTEICGELYRAREMSSYDTACFSGKLKSGINFAVAVTHATKQELPFEIEIEGTKGWVKVSKDGQKLESSWGNETCSESTALLIKRLYDEYIDFLNGTKSRHLSTLADTRGYLLATNGLLLSSRKIKEIPDEFVHSYLNEDQDRGYDVTGLYEAVRETIQTGKLFSEQRLPWSMKTQTVNVGNLTHCYCPNTETELCAVGTA